MFLFVPILVQGIHSTRYVHFATRAGHVYSSLPGLAVDGGLGQGDQGEGAQTRFRSDVSDAQPPAAVQGRRGRRRRNCRGLPGTVEWSPYYDSTAVGPL